MDLKNLKELDEKTTPGPWGCFFKHKYNEWHVNVPLCTGGMKLALFPDGCPTENPEADSRMIATLRNLAPELIALWEAIQTDRDNREYEENMDLTDNALKALNDKARSMVA